MNARDVSEPPKTGRPRDAPLRRSSIRNEQFQSINNGSLHLGSLGSFLGGCCTNITTVPQPHPPQLSDFVAHSSQTRSERNLQSAIPTNTRELAHPQFSTAGTGSDSSCRNRQPRQPLGRTVDHSPSDYAFKKCTFRWSSVPAICLRADARRSVGSAAIGLLRTVANSAPDERCG